MKIGRKLVVAADKDPLKFQMLFSEYELLENGKLWLQSDDGEVVYDEQLNELIPFKQQEISFLPYGYVISDEEGFSVINDSFQPVNQKPFDELDYNATWLSVRNDSTWDLLKTVNYVKVADELDDIRLLGSYFALAVKKDTTLLFTSNSDTLVIGQEDQVLLLSFNGHSGEFVQVKSAEGTMIIDHEGNKIMPAGSEKLSALGEYIIFTQKNKKGLYSKKGKLLNARYDAIGNYEDGCVSLLKGKKFGLFSEKKEVFIPTEYDRRVEPYGPGVFTGQKDGQWGLIDGEGKALSEFAYQEIAYWTDSVALVSLDGQWDFYNIKEKRLSGEGIRSFTYVEKSEQEIVIITLGENGYGVLSNIRGEIIPQSFNDIVNIGKKGRPVYFTEKHISEAEFYVVIYYDQDGQVIRKQAFESADYDMIYCDK